VPFSPVVRAGDWVYVSGMAPINPETGGYDILPIDQQARRVLEHLKSCLEAAGSGLDRVVKCNVYCSNPSYFAAINVVYAEYFAAYKPARIFICTRMVRPFDMEIDCVALVK
jgi:Putative translation initiation inhibitor, yjgF family